MVGNVHTVLEWSANAEGIRAIAGQLQDLDGCISNQAVWGKHWLQARWLSIYSDSPCKREESILGGKAKSTERTYKVRE